MNERRQPIPFAASAGPRYLLPAFLASRFVAVVVIAIAVIIAVWYVAAVFMNAQVVQVDTDQAGPARWSDYTTSETGHCRIRWPR